VASGIATVAADVECAEMSLIDHAARITKTQGGTHRDIVGTRYISCSMPSEAIEATLYSVPHGGCSAAKRWQQKEMRRGNLIGSALMSAGLRSDCQSAPYHGEK
jgi:hypothetical protein